MSGIILFVSLAIFLIISVPIGISLGLAVLVTIIFSDSLQMDLLASTLVASVDSFPLMAVPFFILAGEIMGKGGISERLFRVADALVGNRTGGFAIATILTCLFFASISGSGPATVAAIGGIMIPAMVKEGYDKKFATAVVCAAGSLGIIIPPSIPLVVYGVTGGASIGDLFIGGIIPGIFIATALIGWTYYYSRKKGYSGSDEKTSLKKIINSIWEAKWALMMPVIILGGIYGGIFTPTEAAAVAVGFGMVAGLFLYKELNFKDLPGIVVNSALITATIMIIVGSAASFGRIMTAELIPIKVTELILSISEDTIIVMLLITILLLIVGMFMDAVGAIIILTPILMPVVVNLGIDPIHFGIIMIVNLSIGFLTPPLGVNLFVGSGISGLSIETLSKAVMPFVIAMILTLIVIILIPQLSLMLL